MELNEARNIALRRLSAREYSSAEMKAFLKRKGVEEPMAREVVDRLVETGLISDERYSKVVARHQVMRGKGPGYIRMKLRQKGITAETSAVRELVGEVSGETDLELARRVVEARYPNVLTDRAEAQRAYQALIRRGFSFDVARTAVFKGRDTEE